MKEMMDDLGAILAIIVLWPIVVLIALWVKIDSPGPVFFRQTRLGKDGNPFQLLKFRTMHTDSAHILNHHLDTHPDMRLTWEAFQKLIHDPRLTRPGRVLRRLSLDELPQLWNVLRGEMSLVGPRPCLPEQREFYGDDFGTYASMKPGMTGLWQVSGRNRLSFSERVALDVKYVREWSLWLDVKILLKTVKVVVKMDGAF